MDSLTSEDKDYFKRVITMILIRNELKLDEKDMADVMKELDIRLSKEDDNKIDYEYVKYKLDNHFELKNKDNTIVNELIQAKIPVYVPQSSDRVDLRKLQTYTIDYVKFAKNYKGLYDDAISMQ